MFSINSWSGSGWASMGLDQISFQNSCRSAVLFFHFLNAHVESVVSESCPTISLPDNEEGTTLAPSLL